MKLILPPLTERMNRALLNDYNRVAIVGGALRDLITNRTPKDIDLVVFGLADKAKDFARDIDCDFFPNESLEKDTKSSKTVDSHRVYINDKNIDVIFLIDDSSLLDFINTFDIGLCRIGHTGSHYIIHEHFLEDLDENCIRVRGGGSYGEDSIRKRLKRFKEYYPDFSIDDKLLEKIFPK